MKELLHHRDPLVDHLQLALLILKHWRFSSEIPATFNSGQTDEEINVIKDQRALQELL